MGIGNPNLLYRWKAELVADDGQMAQSLDQEVKELRDKLRRAERERDILRRVSDLYQVITVLQLIFLDETAADTKMARRHGRAFRGSRLVSKVPHGRWNTTTSLAGLMCNGLMARLIVDGSMNGDMFRGYVEQHLAKELQPGDIVTRLNKSLPNTRHSFALRPRERPTHLNAAVARC